MHTHHEAFLARHADKGEWKFNESELKNEFAEPEANLVRTILEEKGLIDQTLPLKLDGLKRSIKAGALIYERLPERAVLVTIDSKKPRADLSLSIISARIGQLESKFKHDKTHAKSIDLVHVEEAELSQLLQDESTDTWDNFAAMMETESISESEAIARQVNAINRPEVMVPGIETLEQAAGRYKKVLEELRSRITSERVPVAILGIGHSGPLSVIA